MIPDDKMAVSVELTDFERVAGFVNPGNEVAIFATALEPVAPAAGQQGAEARQHHSDRSHTGAGPRRRYDVRQLADDGERGRSTATEEVARTILTIAVTQDEAEKLFQADRTSELNFALLTEDTKVSDQPGSRLGDVFPEIFRGQP